MATLQHYLSLVKYNVKIQLNLNFTCAVFLAMLTPLIFSLELLEYKDVAIIGEMYLAIIGILLTPYLSLIELNQNVSDIVRCKRTSHSSIFLLRYLIALTTTLILILLPLLLAKYRGSIFPIYEIWLGTAITSVYFGIAGLTVANISNSISAGYLTSFGYFFLEVFAGSEITRGFYPLSLLWHNFNLKYPLIVIIILLLAINTVWISKK